MNKNHNKIKKFVFKKVKIKQKSKPEKHSDNNIYDQAKWHFHNKNSKRIWSTLKWLESHNYLTNIGKQTFEYGHKGKNGLLRISKTDVTFEGRKIMDKCYDKIGNKYDQVSIILTQCSKKV